MDRMRVGKNAKVFIGGKQVGDLVCDDVTIRADNDSVFDALQEAILEQLKNEHDLYKSYGLPNPMTDEEIIEMLKSNMEKAFTENAPEVEQKSICEHEYAEYQGLVESYKYCKKCDQKA